MNKNFVIGLIILALAGGVLYFMAGSIGTPNVATTTPPAVENSNSNNTNTTVTTTTTNAPQAAAPIAITVSSVSPSDTAAVVLGTVNPKGAFTSYWYEYGNTSNLGSKTSSQTIGSGFLTIEAPGYITDLVKNTTYYFRFVAENKYGRVVGDQYTFKTTEGNPPPVGSAPTTKTVSASGISRTTANINGEVTPNKTATRYWFEYGKTVEMGNISAISSVGDGSVKVSVSASLSDLDPATTYYFRLNAQNQFGTMNGSILNFKTEGPASATAPKVVTQAATSVSVSAATLHGSVDPNGAQTKYWFEYSTDSLLGSVLLKTTVETTLDASSNTSSVKADISDLNSKTTYYFRLVGQNSQGIVRGDNMTLKTK